MATKTTHHERTREEQGFTQGLFVEGIRDSVNSVEKVKEVAKVGALGAIGLRLSTLGGVGTGLWVGGGIIAMIYGGWKGHSRAKESQVPFGERHKTLRKEVASADANVEKAERSVDKLDREVVATQEALNKVLETITLDGIGGLPPRPPANEEEALDYLSHELEQYQTILDLAQEAQRAQEDANKVIRQAEKKLGDAIAIRERDPDLPGTPAVPPDLTAAPGSPAFMGAPAGPPTPGPINPELRAKRTAAIQEARAELTAAWRKRDEVGESINGITMQEIEDTINDARGQSNRILPLPPAGWAPPVVGGYTPTVLSPPGTLATAMDRIEPVEGFDRDPLYYPYPPEDQRPEAIRDFGQLIKTVTKLQEQAKSKQTSITGALDTLSEKEAARSEAQATLTSAQETQRYANEQYDTLMDPDHRGRHLTITQAGDRYERRQRNRRIGAIIGGVATYFTAYFGGGALISAGFDAAFVGSNSWFNTGMESLTNDIIEPMTQTPWWQKWF